MSSRHLLGLTVVAFAALGCDHYPKTPEEALGQIEHVVTSADGLVAWQLVDPQTRSAAASVLTDERLMQTIVKAKYPPEEARRELERLAAADEPDDAHFFARTCKAWAMLEGYRKRLGSVSGPIQTKADGDKAMWVSRIGRHALPSLEGGRRLGLARPARRVAAREGSRQPRREDRAGQRGPLQEGGSSMTHRVAVIPGDGIGVEVTREAVRVLDAVRPQLKSPIELTELDWGAERWLRDGTTLPAGAADDLRTNYGAILFGALGDPRVPEQVHARDILLGLRFQLDLYVNLRPVRLLDEKLPPLKGKTPTRHGHAGVPREHRGSVRGRRRQLQEGHARRDRDQRGRQHAQGRGAHPARRLRRGARAAQEGCA